MDHTSPELWHCGLEHAVVYLAGSLTWKPTTSPSYLQIIKSLHEQLNECVALLWLAHWLLFALPYFMCIQITWSLARSNLLFSAFPRMAFQWLMQGQWICVNLSTPLTHTIPSPAPLHMVWYYLPDAEERGAGTFCGQYVINVFDSTLNLDHIKSLTLLMPLSRGCWVCVTNSFI